MKPTAYELNQMIKGEQIERESDYRTISRRLKRVEHTLEALLTRLNVTVEEVPDPLTVRLVNIKNECLPGKKE